jgi:hypothetical protein
MGIGILQKGFIKISRANKWFFKRKSMSIEKAYNLWSSSYDDLQNKTRDLEELVG